MLELFAKLCMNAASVANALWISAARRSGLLRRAELSFVERLESAEEYNTLLGGRGVRGGVRFKLELHCKADLRGFLDPTDLERFVTVMAGPGSFVELPGVAARAELENGRIKLTKQGELSYLFEFFGDRIDRDIGQRRVYYYRGIKRLAAVNQSQAWSTLTGAVYDKATGRRVLDSLLFSVPGSSAGRLRAVLSSLRIG